KGGTAMAGGVITMMAMAIFGGLWMPLEMFPDWMQQIGRAIPTYWISQLGTWSLQGGELPVAGLLVIGAWTLGLGGLCVLSLRRAVGLTRRCHNDPHADPAGDGPGDLGARHRGRGRCTPGHAARGTPGGEGLGRARVLDPAGAVRAGPHRVRLDAGARSRRC